MIMHLGWNYYLMVLEVMNDSSIQSARFGQQNSTLWMYARDRGIQRDLGDGLRGRDKSARPV
jgi:hypothetical protein